MLRRMSHTVLTFSREAHSLHLPQASSTMADNNNSSHLRYKIFQDLDGCLADFEKLAKEVLTAKFDGQKDSVKDWIDAVGPNNFWKTIAQHGGFFENLPWMSDGKQLWQALLSAGHMPTILTGCPRGKWAPPQKRRWCLRELGPEVEVITCMAARKSSYCSGEMAVLIDDNKKAEEPWIKAGGIFVLHRDTDSTLKQLASIGVLPNP